MFSPIYRYHRPVSRWSQLVSFSKMIGMGCCFLLWLAVIPVQAQQVVSGTLRGTVVDESSALVNGATVRLTNQGTGQVRETQTSGDGFYTFPSIPVGTYALRVIASGFKPSEAANVNVTIGAVSTIDFKLVVGDTGDVVVVDAADSVPLVETTRAGESTLINSRQVTNLPVNGRNFKDFITLSPNVFPARSPESNSFGNSISIAGQRTYDTQLNIDGADFVNPFFAEPAGGTRPPFTISLESVQEFQVITGGGSAEYGRTTGGSINVVTKSGTNDFHGTAFWFFRNKNLTANDAFDREPTDFTQNQFGGNVGGPIVRDRLFFFTAVDVQRRKDPFVANFGPGLENFLPELQGRTDANQNAAVVLGKIDWTPDTSNILNYRFNYSRFELTKRGGGNTLGIGLDHFGTEKPVTQSHVAQYTRILSPKAVNEFRFQYLRENRQVIADNGGPEVQILQEGLVFGPNLFQNVPFNINDKYQIVDHLSYTTGSHSFKFGTDINLTGANEIFKGGVQGGYGYDSVADFPNKPLYYFQIVGANGVSVEDATTFKARQREFALFAQDSWRIRSNFTLNLGLRWEGTKNPQPTRPNPAFASTSSVPNDYNNFAPRIGLAWDPNGDGKQVIRADFGLNYGRVPAIYLFQAFNTNGVTNGAFFFFGDVPVTFPQTLPTSIPDAPLGSDVFAFDPNFELTRSGMVNVSYERDLGRNFSFLATFTGSRTRNVPFVQNLNLASGFIDTTGRFVYDRSVTPFPDYGRVFNLTSLGYDEYKALTLGVQKRFSNRFQFQANYTLSRTKDTVSEEQPLFDIAQSNQFDPGYEFTTSARDIRHRFIANSVFELPYGFRLSGIFTALSGRPIDEVTGEDLNNDGNSGNDRVLGPDGRIRERNSQRGPAFYNFDVRVSKTFNLKDTASVEVLAEVFNLFRADNLGSNGTTNDGFSVVRRDTPAGPNSVLNSAGSPQQMQLGVRFRF